MLDQQVAELGGRAVVEEAEIEALAEVQAIAALEAAREDRIAPVAIVLTHAWK